MADDDPKDDEVVDPKGEQPTEDAAGSQSTDTDAGDAPAQGDAKDEKSAEFQELVSRFEKLEGENRALRDTVQQSLTPPEPDPEPTPELQRNTRRTEALESKLASLETARSDTLKTVADARGSIKYIEGQIERADDLDRPELKAQLAEAKKAASDSEKEYRSFGAKNRDLRDQLAERKDERKGIEATIKEQRASQRQADEDAAEFQRGFPAYVEGLINEAADGLKIPSEAKVRSGLHKALRSSVSMELAQMKDRGVKDVDMPALVKAHVQEFADLRNLGDREAFDKESKEKRSVQRQPAARRAAAPTGDEPPPKPRWQDTETRTPAMQAARDGLEASLEKHARDEATREQTAR